MPDAVDDVKLGDWPQFFTEDALYHVTTRENHEAALPIGIVRCLGRGMMTDRVKASYSANVFEPHVYNHIIGRQALSDTQSSGPGVVLPFEAISFDRISPDQ
ncbi:hypothetical protein MTX26_31210 [Bradyrhizobium sp. ISRA443]|uniref:hypothetical protein n=1 Tax=unclassified Bradyrhizobium TaxID=2631580 RepID=UPI002478A5F2|nr:MULTISPECIES: hypothetical protein [unclassified Bradyrhizobium]WGR94006.1 hypothetical protein MTX20_06230 [Bradyrhizobium sp. ISRA435]WGR98634.1 hypothetical protein MTX23_31190 [Bradyrhizobium sp. ISRA436]WGS05523.1 hypothetical protein MTX18_31210 [Bradyrhizobium sp. ISRA437]WGS12410.1 hypothetical protein MTX26_31210 [Bradyrhizobium sp. ISRA443]